jgi:hypothetical protein
MWCGKNADSGWIVAATLNPCAFNSGAALVLAAVAAAVVWAQAQQLGALSRLGRDRSYLWAVPGARRPLLAQAAAAAALAALHAASLLYFLDARQRTPYLIFSEALLTLSWAAATAVVVAALRRDACVRLRPLAWAAAGAYAAGAYSEAQFYAHGLGISPLQREVRLAAGLVAAALAAAFLGAELQK